MPPHPSLEIGLFYTSSDVGKLGELPGGPPTVTVSQVSDSHFLCPWIPKFLFSCPSLTELLSGGGGRGLPSVSFLLNLFAFTAAPFCCLGASSLPNAGGVRSLKGSTK